MKNRVPLKIHTPGRHPFRYMLMGCMILVMTLVAISGYGKNHIPHLFAAQETQQPSAHFPHEEHMDFLDCLDCHHEYEDGENKLDEDDLYEGNPDIQCGTCHNGKRSFPLLRAFHRQCIQCHEAEKSGPVLCGECHEGS